MIARAVYSSLFSALLSLAACSWVSVSPLPYAGTPAYPPTDPETVEVLREVPPGPFLRVGQIHLDWTGSPGQSAVLFKLRRAAAKMGADAVIVSGDTSLPPRSWWNRLIDPDPDQVLVGIAIRYPR